MRGNIDRLVEMGYDGVILTGGEPSTSELLLPALAYAREKRLFSRMITNGQKLADKAFFKRCVEAGLTHIHVSLHSYRREVHDFITQYRGAWDVLIQCLSNVPEMGITCDINTVINVYNCDHLHENVQWISENFPFIRHFVWNNLDPSMGRAETNRDTAHRLADFELSLARAMRFLHKGGRTFRVERVPLCYMTEFAHCSTETRKIVKGEERIVHFLDEKGTVRQTDFVHAKSEACQSCTLNDVCGGLFELGEHYDLAELYPVFVPADEIVRKVRAEID